MGFAGAMALEISDSVSQYAQTHDGGGRRDHRRSHRHFLVRGPQHEILANGDAGRDADDKGRRREQSSSESQSKSNSHRQIQTLKSNQSPNPSDHYVCGIGYQDASTSCTHPCPSGSPDECPPGQLCYFDTPCDSRNLPSQPTGSPANEPKEPTAAPWSGEDRRWTYFCGSSWGDAGERCEIWCPDADDTKCPEGEQDGLLRFGNFQLLFQRGRWLTLEQ